MSDIADQIAGPSSIFKAFGAMESRSGVPLSEPIGSSLIFGEPAVRSFLLIESSANGNSRSGTRVGLVDRATVLEDGRRSTNTAGDFLNSFCTGSRQPA